MSEKTASSAQQGADESPKGLALRHEASPFRVQTCCLTVIRRTKNPQLYPKVYPLGQATLGAKLWECQLSTYQFLG
ncbi:hypothetical protein [Pleurocapsa sp. PCC 7319]|uniref:hypothetical protein n=1 Tax=Pleurocapsa sp. PCC 7319 TaxID=118161 RepID=UPI001181A764|nr:hypothetical protein [Pleurocapsa sp. PCC 7319]